MKTTFRTHLLMLVVALVAIAFVGVNAQKSTPRPSADARGGLSQVEGRDLFERARVIEETNQKLSDVIKMYEQVVVQSKSDRALAAQAILRMAECYRKLGDDQARKMYERVVREYADQKEAVALARARLGAPPPLAQATRTVWTGPQADWYESSISPDGRFISFPDWDSGNLGLHDLTTGTDRLLTNTGRYKRGETEYAEASAISRDGKQVAYAWYEDKTLRYELRVLNLNGDPSPRRVFGNPDVSWVEPRDWSPDGQWIGANLYAKNAQVGQIALINAQDGSVRRLRPGTENQEFGRFSRDGKYVVYTRGQSGTASRSRGYILSIDRGSEVALIPETSFVENPVWTVDGSRIVFISDLGGSDGLWSIGVANGQPSGEAELLRKPFSSSFGLMNFVGDGSLFYGVSSSQTDIYVAGLNPATGALTSEPKRVNERSVGNSSGRIAWLPDGKSLSYWNNPPIDALVEHNLSNGDEREIWAGKSGRKRYAGYTGWFPDGRTLMAREPDGQMLAFRRVDSRTGEVQASWTVPRLPAGANPVFSPDLMTMYFSQKDDRIPCNGVICTFGMIARSLETGQDREVFQIRATDGRTLNYQTSISRDGRQMAFIMYNDHGASLMVAPTAGGAPREIYRNNRLDDNVNFSGTVWTPDGSHVLALQGQARPTGSIWSFPTNGGAPEKSPLRTRLSQGLAISPDGSQIAFVGGTVNREILVMTGLFAKPKD